MENDFWNNPGLKNMSPEKLQFLMNFASKEKPTNIKDMMPFLLGTMNAAKINNIQFTDPETELLVTLLKQNMSKEESEKADKIIRLMKDRLFHLPILYEFRLAGLFPIPSVPSKYFALADSNKTNTVPSAIATSSEQGGISTFTFGSFGFLSNERREE